MNIYKMFLHNTLKKIIDYQRIQFKALIREATKNL